MERNHNIAVVVPVYKSAMTSDELLSFRQTIKVLGRYDIWIVCPQTLDTDSYRIEFPLLKVTTFSPDYFDGIAGYNRLMKSNKFYHRFLAYRYILICQLDAWVFADKLEYWAGLGYDYIGSPWFEHVEGKDWNVLKTDENGNYKLWKTGNGGLSLRKVQTFETVTRRFQRTKTIVEIFTEEYHSLKDLGKCLLLCCGPLVGTNSMRHFINTHTRHVWEDAFFCIELTKTRFRMNIPSPEEAAFFSFECQPQYLYEHVTKGELPFGCHGWRKYQKDFWQQFIENKKE